MAMRRTTATARGTRRNGELTLLAVTATWGTTFVAIQDLLPAWPPFWLMTVRFSLAAALMLPATLAVPAVPVAARRPGRGPLAAGLIVGLWAFAGFSLQTVSLQYTSPAHSAFGTAMTTVLVPLLSCLVDRHPWRGGTGVALVAAGGGIALLLGGQIDPGVRTGDLLAVAAACAFSWQMVLLARFGRDLAPLPLTAGQVGVTAVLSALTALYLGEPAPSGLQASWPQVFYLGWIATAGCLLGQVWGQGRTNATRAAFIFALEPLFATAFGWLTHGQPISLREACGGLLVIAAAGVADRPLPRRRAARR